MTGIVDPDQYGRLADAIAAAVLAVPGVVRLSGGQFGTVATYLPGRRVTGVSLTDDGATVAFVGSLGVDLARVAARVREVVGALTGLPTEVIVADVDTGDDHPGAATTPNNPDLTKGSGT